MAYELQVIGEMVANYGFPAVAFGLMYRMAETTIAENTESINELRQSLDSE